MSAIGGTTMTIANITPVLVNGVHLVIGRTVPISSRLKDPWGLTISLYPLHHAVCVINPFLVRTVTRTIFIVKTFHPSATLTKSVWSAAKPMKSRWEEKGVAQRSTSVGGVNAR